MNHSEQASTISICPHCKQEFTYMRGRGRTPIYCSDNCRKYAAAHRKYAQETGAPVRIMKDTVRTQPHPEPKVVTVYQRPRKKDLRAYLRENPQELLPDLLRELGYCFTSRKISREEREKIAQAFGFALLHLHTAETVEPINEKKTLIRSGLSSADYAVLAEKIGVYEQLCEQVKKQQEKITARERYLDAYISRRARTLACADEQGTVKELRQRLRELEKATERSTEVFYSQLTTMEKRYQDSVQQRFQLVQASQDRMEDLEAEVVRCQEHARRWEKVAKMTQARAEEAAARGGFIPQGQAGASFFKEK